MEEHQRKWEACQQVIRQEVGTHVYDVWFADIVCAGYDEQQHTVLLEVPSRYVYEYIEELHVRLMQQVLSGVFMENVRLNYRIANQSVNAQPSDILHQTSSGIPQFSIANARKRLEDGLRHFLGDGYQWLPAYDKVADWLSDNKGRGLLCVGTSGLGKTLLCTKVLPVILGSKIPVVSAQEMTQRIDSLLKERCVIIDDLGKEPVETRTYGNRRTPFFELCDTAERQGKLLVITTNLSTTPVGDPRYPESIQHRYGDAVISRLRAITRVVVFEGNDMRKLSLLGEGGG